MKVTSIARLKVTLDDVKPDVLRLIEVPLMIRLDRLHLVLQAAMGWTNSHLYEIRAGEVGWGRPDPDFDDGPLDARKTRLIDVLEDTGRKMLRYLYDFGDGWDHTVKIERLAEATPGQQYPVLIEAIGRCPPEDVGGPWGYGESWKHLPTLSTSSTPSCGSGSATTTNQHPSTIVASRLTSRHLPKNGPANHPQRNSHPDVRGSHRTDTLRTPPDTFLRAA